MVRDEYPLIGLVINDLQNLRVNQDDDATIRHHQFYAIIEYHEMPRIHLLKVLFVSRNIWETLLVYLYDKYPMGYPYSDLPLNNAMFYTLLT